MKAVTPCPQPLMTRHVISLRHDCGAIARAAVRSLYDELSLHPKPGMVSLVDNGSHDDMNRLQNLPGTIPYCVTLNAQSLIDSAKVLRTMQYNHPLYTKEAVAAQDRWAEISGQRHIHFCGAYWSYGFHEDGLTSAIRVAKQLGVNW